MEGGPEINAIYQLSITGTKFGVLPERQMINANTLDDLRKQVNDLKFAVEKIEVDKPSLVTDFKSEDEKVKLADILLEFTKRSFTVTQIIGGYHPQFANLFSLDQKKAQKFNAFLKRNSQFNLRKFQIAWASPFLAILTSAILSGFFSIYLALILPAYLTINYVLKNYKYRLEYSVNTSLALIVLNASTLAMIVMGTFTVSTLTSHFAFGLTPLFALGGLFLNYIRDWEIKNSITKYEDKQLNPEEVASLKLGAEAQNAYAPLLNWTIAWFNKAARKYPRAFLVGYHNPGCDIDEKLQAHSEFNDPTLAGLSDDQRLQEKVKKSDRLMAFEYQLNSNNNRFLALTYLSLVAGAASFAYGAPLFMISSLFVSFGTYYLFFEYRQRELRGSLEKYGNDPKQISLITDKTSQEALTVGVNANTCLGYFNSYLKPAAYLNYNDFNTGRIFDKVKSTKHCDIFLEEVTKFKM